MRHNRDIILILIIAIAFGAVVLYCTPAFPAVTNWGGNTLTGLSGDSKPTNVPDGSRFLETDTQIWYVRTGSNWVAIKVGATNVTSPFWSTTGHGHAGMATESWVTTITNGKEPSISSGAAGQYWTGSKAWQSFEVTMVPLGNAYWSTTGHGHTGMATEGWVTTITNGKENTIATGAAGQYWTGSKAWESFSVTLFPLGDGRWSTLGHGHSGMATESWVTTITNGKEPTISTGAAGQYWTGSKAWESFTVTMFPAGDGRWTTLGHGHSYEPVIASGGAGQVWINKTWGTLDFANLKGYGGAGQVLLGGGWSTLDFANLKGGGGAGQALFGGTTWSTIDFTHLKGYGGAGQALFGGGWSTVLNAVTAEKLSSAHCTGCHGTRQVKGASFVPVNTSWNTTVVQTAYWVTMPATMTNVANTTIRLQMNGQEWMTTGGTLTYTVTWSSVSAAPGSATTRLTFTNVPTARVLTGYDLRCDAKVQGTGSQTVQLMCWQEHTGGTTHALGWATFTWDMAVPIGFGVNTQWSTLLDRVEHYNADVRISHE